MALLSQVFDYARRNDQQKQYESLSAIFILPTEAGFGQLSQELQSISDTMLEKQTAALQIHGSEFSEVLKKYLKFVKLFPTGDWNALARSMIELLKSCTAILKPKQMENKQIESVTWFTPSLRKLCLTALGVCGQADRLNPKALMRGNAFADLRTLLGIANLRNNKDKYAIVLFLAGQIVRMSLQLDAQGTVAHTLRQVYGVVTRMEQAPQADRLRFCYWAGKWHLLEHRVGVAYSLLRTAFSICPNKMTRHKRSIFRQLVGAAVPLGIFPHPILLQAFGFHTYFLPVIKAIKAGDAIALDLAIDSPQPREWFRRYGLHTVLKEKCCARGRSVDSISFPLLTKVFRLSYDVDDGWGPVRIQSIVMSLVAQGYIVGRVEGTETLSLKPNGTRRERFPPFGSVRQTYQVQTVWGVNLK
ncbi:hypothetical protein CPB86DRAFT_774377 [Serendipita vermifera]|nr:hypothetical protein CPB86DRAFT_774377 [Serendipita vermifera]